MATTHFDESPLAAPLTLVRGSARAERRGGRPMRLAALRAPLAVKVIGANLSVLAALALFFLVAPAGGWGVGVVAVAVTVAILAYVALVIVALRPVNDLESVATRVWLGDYGARVASSATADADVVRIGSMFNNHYSAVTLAPEKFIPVPLMIANRIGYPPVVSRTFWSVAVGLSQRHRSTRFGFPASGTEM